MSEEKWRIHEICKTCIYRETAGWSVKVTDDWSNTCCTYSIYTGQSADRSSLTDTFCPYYIKAQCRAKKYDEAIKRNSRDKMKKKNPILKNPDIMAAVFYKDDEIFLKKNKYGYLANLKHPEVYKEYIKFLKSRNNAHILSDEERFYFDNQMIKKFRPQISNMVTKLEYKEGSGLMKVVSTDTSTGTILCWDEGRKNKQGLSEEWLVKSPKRENAAEVIEEWISDPEIAVTRYTETIYTALFHRIHNYYKKMSFTV